MKTFTKILSILLAVMMLVCLVACDKDEDGGKGGKKGDSIVGKWEGKLSDKAIEEMLGAEDLDIDTELMIYFEFDEDGEGKMGFDEDNFKDFVEEFAELSLEMMAEEMGMTADDMLSAMDMTKDEYIDLVFAEMDSTEMEIEFAYEIDGDEMTLTNEDDEESVITFELDGDELKMTDIEEEGASEDLIAAMFPLTLERK